MFGQKLQFQTTKTSACSSKSYINKDVSVIVAIIKDLKLTINPSYLKLCSISPIQYIFTNNNIVF